MLYVNAFILAVVEGLTEFLPVSSTGHMILVEKFLPITSDPASPFRHAFIELIQLPAIAAVGVYFWKRLWPFGQPPEERKTTFAIWLAVIAAFFPAAILGKLFKKSIEAYLFFEVPVAIALVVGGILLIVIERRKHTTRFEAVQQVPLKTAVMIGFFQCLAFFPGTSRSAATIIGAMLLGLSRAAAAEFSFFLAIPTMCGASALTILESGLGFTAQEWSLLGLGSLVSFLTAYASVAFLMRFIQRHDFTFFGVYRILLGGIVLLDYFV